MKVIKRNGKEVDFNIEKILSAVTKANETVIDEFKMSDTQIQVVAEKTEKYLNTLTHTPNIEEIQDTVIREIMRQQAYGVAKNYTEYRYKRELARKKNSTDDTILSLIEYENEEVKQENSNKNPARASVQRDYMAGEVSKDLTTRVLLPEDVVKNHLDGLLHFHDSDYYAQHIHNCCLVNLEDMLQNGTTITETQITKPNSLTTAANITTQIIAQIASNQYGGQTITLTHLAPFVDVSRQKFIRQITEEFKSENINATDEQIKSIAEIRLKREITAAIQTIQYQLVTLMTTNGQTPFVSIFMYLGETEDERVKSDLALLIEEMLIQRIKGLPNEKGVWVTPAFPKLLYVLEEDNINSNSKYFYLTKLAAECTAKRMVPDYISEKIMKELKQGDCYPCMGCRSFLTPDRFSENSDQNISNAKNYKEKEHKYYGRFNQGVVTINLPAVALESNKDINKFWEIFDNKLELCHKALRCRHERLKGTTSDIAPILWQHGALARLEKGETIDKLLYNGYSTISLGYAGLYEMCIYMTGKSHTDPIAKKFALSVMQYMNDKCAEWKSDENIDYSIYGTPLESTTYKFAKALQNKYGIVKDVTDHNYITNSYHINVREPIDAFSKLKFEAEFQALSPGGAISYVEIPDMQNNIPAVLKIIRFIYDNIMYAELNTKSDYCEVCGFDGEIQIVESENKKLYWKCPNCGNTDQDKMSVARRTCGYIGSNFWNQGRTEEIKDRVLHVSNHIINQS